MTAATNEPLPVEGLSYTDASRELDSIVEFFEQREVDVDVLVARLERATALIDELDRRLRHTGRRSRSWCPDSMRWRRGRDRGGRR
jgi:exonuclease VII small subunit